MNGFDDMIQLAKILETEWKGGSVDRVRARELASRLMPQMPELRATLTSVHERMAH
ncbi:MAG: hypothetical protein AB1918_15305 [Pseudomonadota bacterium]